MNVTPCASCKHFQPEVKDRNLCAAFPKGIPSAIVFGENQHRKPFRGDHGIRWEPLPGFEFLRESTAARA